MSWEIHERYKHARRDKETNIFAKERALDKVIDQRISLAIISRRNLTRIMGYIYWIPQGRATVKSCNISMWCMQKVQWWTIQDAKTSRLAQRKNP